MKSKGQTSISETGPKSGPIFGDQILERRQRPGKAGTVSLKKDQVIGGLEAFKHVLDKHAVRYARQGTPYALARLEILQWAEVAKNFGQSACKQLLRTTQEAILKGLRASDRLCEYLPGKFIVLLADCNQKTAKQVLERICLVASTCKTQYHKTSLRSSLSTKLTAADVGHTNIETMLAAIGICEQESPPEASSNNKSQTEESYTSWLARYDNFKACDKLYIAGEPMSDQSQADDRWDSGKPVLLCSISAQLDDYQVIASRASSLMQIEHPGLLRLRDFFIAPQMPLQLVLDFPSGVRLDEFLAKPLLGKSDPSTVVTRWAEQICSCLIVLQKQFPRPLCLEMTSASFFVTKDLQLVFCDFAWSCLCLAEGDHLATSRSFGQFMQGIVHKLSLKDSQLESFFNKLCHASVPKDLNNFYKIRTSLLQRVY